MDAIFNSTALKGAAIITIATLLAANLTSDSSPLIRGASMFGAALIGGYVATKF